MHVKQIIFFLLITPTISLANDFEDFLIEENISKTAGLTNKVSQKLKSFFSVFNEEMYGQKSQHDMTCEIINKEYTKGGLQKVLISSDQEGMLPPKKKKVISELSDKDLFKITEIQHLVIGMLSRLEHSYSPENKFFHWENSSKYFFEDITSLYADNTFTKAQVINYVLKFY